MSYGGRDKARLLAESLNPYSNGICSMSLKYIKILIIYNLTIYTQDSQ